MELNHLRCFYEVARAGSFTAAASKLHVSQSSLSKLVGLLEDREGVKLLERSKKGVALTPLGQEVFDQCHAVFNGVNGIQALLQGSGQKFEGHLRFGASDHLAKYLLVDKIKKFSDKYEKVIPSIFVGSPIDIIGQILKNELEFGLFFTKVDVPGLEYQIICPSELVLVSDYLSKRRIDPTEIGNIGVIGSISREYQQHPSYQIFERAKAKPKINLETNSQDFQKMLCLSGQGCVLLARFMVHEELAQKKLKEIKLAEPIFADLYLVKRKSHVFSRPAEVFVKEVVIPLRA